MGKNNKAQRTKGNTRPSSSSHMPAESVARPFLGFSAGKAGPDFVPVTGIVEDCSLDADFRMAMRKMLKRDPLTRIKAVQEFGDLCSEKDEEAARSVLPFWHRLYSKLALDCERRVREGAHVCQGALCSRVGRALGPQLLTLCPTWLLGQGDLHPIARENARHAFRHTFPSEEKRSQALLFCREEIFQYFTENLFDPNAKVMTDANCVGSEEVEGRRVLVLGASLQALKVLLENLVPGERCRVEEDLRSILQREAFWRHSHHTDEQVRCCWFGLVSCLCRLLPTALAGREDKLGKVVLQCLKERGAAAMSAAWEAALHILQQTQMCLDDVNLQNPLWALLNSGALGPSLLPCLLPFLSRLPPKFISDRLFLSQLFQRLAHGLRLEGVRRSRLHCEALFSALVECVLHFCCTLHAGTDLGAALLEEALREQVLPLVQSSFYDSEDAFLATLQFYPLLCPLLQKMADFPCSLDTFWDGMWDITQKMPLNLKHSHKQIKRFFRCMFMPDDPPDKSRVRFRVSPDDSSSNPKNPTKVLGDPISAQLKNIHISAALKDNQCSSEPSEEPSDSRTSLEISRTFILSSLKEGSPSFKYVVNALQLLHERLKDRFDTYAYGLFCELFVSTLNREVFRALIAVVGKSMEEGNVEFLNEILVRWLPEIKSDADRDGTIDILFKMCPLLPEEASSFLSRCSEIGDLQFLERLLIRLRVFSDKDPFQDWLSSSHWLEPLVSGLRLTADAEVTLPSGTPQEESFSAYRKILDMCFVEPAFKRCLISRGVPEELLGLLEGIVKRETKRVQESGGILLETCALLETILERGEISWEDSKAHNVLFGLLQWILHSPDVEGSISERVLRSWSLGVRSCSEEYTLEGSFLFRAARELRTALVRFSTREEAHHVSLLTATLLREAHPSLRGTLCGEALPQEEDWSALRMGLSMSAVPSLVSGRLFSCLPNDREASVPPAPPADARKLLLVAETVGILLAELPDGGSDIPEHLPHLLWSLAYCRDMTLAFSKDLKTENLTQSCRCLLSRWPSERTRSLLLNLLERSRVEGLPWALALGEGLRLVDEVPIAELLSLAEGVDLVTTQVLLPHLPLESKLELLVSLLRQATQESASQKTGIMARVCCLLQDPRVLSSQDVRGHLVDGVHLLQWCSGDQISCLQDACLLACIVGQVPQALTEEAWEGALGTLNDTMQLCLDAPSPSPLPVHLSASLYHSLEQHLQWRRNCGDNFAPFRQTWTLQLPRDTLRLWVQLFLKVAGAPPGCLPPTVMYLVAETCGPLPPEVLQGMEELSSGLLRCLSTGEFALQIAAHCMLTRWLLFLPEVLDSETGEEEGEEGGRKFPDRLQPLLDLLASTGREVAQCLLEVPEGEHMSVPAGTEAYRSTLAHLMAGDAVLEFVARCPPRLRSGFVEHLEEEELLPVLFSNVFCLLPEYPHTCLRNSEESLRDLFFSTPTLSQGADSLLPRTACWVFCTLLRRVPASLRTWHNNLDKGPRNQLQSFTSKYVSGLLCAEEIRAVQENELNFDNLAVRTRPGVGGEVLAAYCLDGSRLELSIRLPSDYPLGPVTVERKGAQALCPKEWAQWLRQLVALLNYQNGSIVDGLCLWRRNLDKKFEGVEECVICYYVLHSSSLRLPRLSCHVCRKKFHSQCLYKWFRSSNNSTCPLCRNEFRM